MYSTCRLIVLTSILALICLPVFGQTTFRAGDNSGIGFNLQPTYPLLNQKSSGGAYVPEKDVSPSPPDTSGKPAEFVLRKSPSGALFRSFLIPGWGQIYTDQWLKALIFFGTDVGMIYGMTVQHDRYLEYKDKAQNAKTEYMIKQYKRSSAFYKDDRNRLIWWTVGWTLMAGFDAYVEAFLYDFKIDPELSTTPSGDGIKMGLTITFPKG